MTLQDTAKTANRFLQTAKTDKGAIIKALDTIKADREFTALLFLYYALERKSSELKAHIDTYRASILEELQIPTIDRHADSKRKRSKPFESVIITSLDEICDCDLDSEKVSTLWQRIDRAHIDHGYTAFFVDRGCDVDNLESRAPDLMLQSDMVTVKIEILKRFCAATGAPMPYSIIKQRDLFSIIERMIASNYSAFKTGDDIKGSTYFNQFYQRYIAANLWHYKADQTLFTSGLSELL